MNRYQPLIPRVTFGIAAVAMTAITIGVSVIMPAKMDSDSPEPRVLEALTVTAPVPTASTSSLYTRQGCPRFRASRNSRIANQRRHDTKSGFARSSRCRVPRCGRARACARSTMSARRCERRDERWDIPRVEPHGWLHLSVVAAIARPLSSAHPRPSLRNEKRSDPKRRSGVVVRRGPGGRPTAERPTRCVSS
jgi:hypothetical protein